MKRNSVTWILAVAVLLLVWYGWDSRQKIIDRDNVIAYKSDTLKIYHGKDSLWRAERLAMETDMRTAEKHFKKELDQVKNDLGIARRKIASITNVTTHTEGTVQFEKGGPLSFKDDFNTFTLIDTGRVYTLNYSKRDSLLLSGYYEREKFWKPYQLRVKAISYNPDTYISGLDHIQIRNKPGRFGISLQAGYGMTLHGFSPYVGVGVDWEVWRF